MADNIFDHIDGHEVTDSETVEDIDNYISKVEKMRADYRQYLKDFEGIPVEYGTRVEKV